MKHRIGLFLAVMFAATAASAQDPRATSPTVTLRAVASLMEGLGSGNAGLQRSCALMLGQLRHRRSCIALMKVLRNGADERCRGAAAWALCRIGDPSGLMLVKATAERDESPRLRALCAWYYQQSVSWSMEGDAGTGSVWRL